MNTNDIPKVHPELLKALNRHDEQARQMKLSEGFTEKVMEKVKSEMMKKERVNNEKYKLLFIRKIAAVFLAVAFLSGLAFAAFHFRSPKTDNQSAEVTAPSLTGRAGGESSSISFSNLPLDSILNVVAAHYDCIVCFRDSATRTMKFITTWNPEDSLAAFIEHLNMFDGLHLTLRDDTIFVESTNDEEDAQ